MAARSTPDLTPAALAHCPPGQRQAFLWDLERAVHSAVHERVEAALTAVVSGLRESGWDLQQRGDELPYAYTIPTPGGALVLRLHWAGSTSLTPLPEPTPLTAAQLVTRRRQDAFYAAVASALEDADAQGFSRLRPEQKDLVVLAELEAEVNNGGFAQYFFNSAGNHAHLVDAALERAGLARTRRVVRRAMHLFGKEGPAGGRRARQAQLRRLSRTVPEPFREVDRAFGRTGENLAERCALAAGLAD